MRGRAFRPAVIAAFFYLALPVPGMAQSSPVVIWPIDPVIVDQQRATGLWLENPGKTPVQFQVRIFAWNQADVADAYTPQSDVIGTPPVIRIGPGQRQLVRLTRMQPVPAGVERAYRVIVDELPLPTAARNPASATRVQFRMRYSIPLFTYGNGASPPKPGGRGTGGAARPIAWRVLTEGGRRYLEFGNRGRIHLRLVDASFTDDKAPFAKGLLGYVLAGSTMRWPLSNGAGTGALRITINGEPMVLNPAGAGKP